ncbi:transglutaminase-like cysteine peptidase [Sphingomonas sanguinis]|uniref:transglutaminase-like cysteine peptidase n=1 Tax=Sphingomonas sanguinis TaxID=33051 RepID=UPI001C565EBA|nr:transglutaminase-like cysteine peptidase [Sphingomonas sanguinis]QXT35527.1 transglutaminase-like cysteine peptidase [Sphingomonas sanguinis]
MTLPLACRPGIGASLWIAALLAAALPWTPARAEAFVPLGTVADAPYGFTEMCARTPTACSLGAAGAAGARTVEVATCFAFGDGAAGFLPVRSFIPGPFSVDEPQACLPQEGERFGPTGAVGAAASVPSRLAEGSADRGLMRTVKAVNIRANRHIAQRTDREIYGEDEHWQAAGIGAGAAGDCEDIALEKRDELLAAGLSPSQLLLATAFVRNVGLHTVLIVRLSDGDFVLDSLVPSISRWDKVRYAWLRMQDPADPMVWRRMGAI